MSGHLVVALAYDQLCTFEFGCVVEVFALPRPELDVPWYRFAVCAAEPGPLRAAGGFTIAAPRSLRLLEISDRVGFGSEESFRRHFRRVTGVSPSLYKKQFLAPPSHA
jgi:transcriptional regulator GlxA family with amidase domain